MSFLLAYAIIGFIVSSHMLWVHVHAFDDKYWTLHIARLVVANRMQDARETMEWLEEQRAIEPWREVLNDAILGLLWPWPVWANRKKYARLLVMKWEDLRR